MEKVLTEKIKCKNCGKEHIKSNSNCCWEECSCGKDICLNCGYAGEKWEYIKPVCEEDEYCCGRSCPKCGQQYCGKCA